MSSQICNSIEWRFECQRGELAPLHSIDDNVLYKSAPTLLLSGGGKHYVDGRWSTIVKLIPSTNYIFRVHYLISNVAEPSRSVLARILWHDEKGKAIGHAEYPRTLLNNTNNKWNSIEQSYKPPANAFTAKIELVYRWDALGTVHFGGFSFESTPNIKSRRVKLATIHHQPKGTLTSSDNINQFTDLISKHKSVNADIICLPEAINMVGTSHDYISAAETLPGASTDLLGKLACQLNCYIVAGIIENDRNLVYNSAVLINRTGDLSGIYRKVSLPREEIDGGITPGSDIPVFDTDFGRIGIMICWDVSFPEVARTLYLKGAEVIFMPIWGGNITLAKARAIENQVYLVTSGYDMQSAIFDKRGQIIKETSADQPIAVSEVDLDCVEMWPWLGDYRSRISKEMPTRQALFWKTS